MKYIIILIWLSSEVAAQSSSVLSEYKKSVQGKSNKVYQSNRMIKEDGKINYLAPLLYNYANEKDLLNKYDKRQYFDNLTQTISFLGDFKSIIEYLRLGYQPIDSGLHKSIEKRIKAIKSAAAVDARSFILEKVAPYKVVMINEAHSNPLHRAFAYSLLTDFYNKGFRYLAMETFNNTSSGSLTELNQYTGYYTCEPVCGELVRKALRLGFKLIAYEDTVYTSTDSQRDSAQAMHIYQVIQKDSLAKILVYAGYGHIEKLKGNNERLPMALQFKSLSNIEPYCISQTSISEAGNDAFSNSYYELILKHFLIEKSSVLVNGNEPVQLSPWGKLFDLTVIHPPSTYRLGRATWYSLNNERRFVTANSNRKNTFLIQAYYTNEFLQNPLFSIIPADQTYIKTKGNYYPLYLKKGKYKIVSRDMEYNIIQIENKTVL